MANIKAKNTTLEINFCKKLSAKIYPRGYRYRKHYKNCLGTPDIAFPREKLVIFLDGDFWHGKNYKAKSKKYAPYWKEKIGGNMRRDAKYNRKLKTAGFKVLRFWESDLKRSPEKAIRKIEIALKPRLIV